jgi:hypothetical protein
MCIKINDLKLIRCLNDHLIVGTIIIIIPIRLLNQHAGIIFEKIANLSLTSLF